MRTDLHRFTTLRNYESQPVGLAEVIFASEARFGGLGGGRGQTAQNLEMVGGEFVQGINFPLHVPCRNWVTVGYRFPPGPFFGGWFVGVQVFSGTSFSGVGDGGAGVGSTGVCFLGVMGKQEQE